MIKLLFVTVSFIILTSTSSLAATASFDERQSNHCARYFKIYEQQNHMPSNLLRAVSTTESGRWSKKANNLVAWPWTINVGGKGYHYESKAAAISAVKKLKAQGRKSIDVGCMQINLRYHPDAFSSLEQAFEPKFNIEYASKFLTNKYKKLGSWEGAIRHYHNANPKHSDKYIARIYQTWRHEDHAIDLAMIDSPAMFITVRERPKAATFGDVSSVTRSALERFIQ